MSVLKSQRNESKLTVLLRAEDLVCYTLDKVNNAHIFPKRQRWQMANRVLDLVLGLAEKVYKANYIHVVDPETKRERRRLQDEALRDSGWLLELLNILIKKHNLTPSTAAYWVDSITEFQHYLKAWQKSDEATYKDI